MSRTLLMIGVLGSCLLLVADQASAELSLRIAAAEQDDVAPAPPSSSGAANESSHSVGSAVVHGSGSPVVDYIAPCCPPPRGYTPIKCDPRAYNCFRAMNSGSRFPYGRRRGG
jgi:hypothetical protein